MYAPKANIVSVDNYKIWCEKALASCDKTLTDNPTDTSTYLHKGSILLSLGRKEEGLDSYNMALSIDLARFNMLGFRS